MTNFETWQQVLTLYANYAAALDNKEWDRWSDFFLEHCVCQAKQRDDHDHDSSLPLLSALPQDCGMLKDHVCGAVGTNMRDSRNQQHVVGIPRIVEDSGTRIRAEAAYAVFRTAPDASSTLYNVGRYLDTIERTNTGLKFAARVCIFDRRAIPDALTGQTSASH